MPYRNSIRILYFPKEEFYDTEEIKSIKIKSKDSRDLNYMKYF